MDGPRLHVAAAQSVAGQQVVYGRPDVPGQDVGYLAVQGHPEAGVGDGPGHQRRGVRDGMRGDVDHRQACRRGLHHHGGGRVAEQRVRHDLFQVGRRRLQVQAG